MFALMQHPRLAKKLRWLSLRYDEVWESLVAA
jgi:hypothetical protein